jgi:hypothetical protein
VFCETLLTFAQVFGGSSGVCAESGCVRGIGWGTGPH